MPHSSIDRKYLQVHQLCLRSFLPKIRGAGSFELAQVSFIPLVLSLLCALRQVDHSEPLKTKNYGKHIDYVVLYAL